MDPGEPLARNGQWNEMDPSEHLAVARKGQGQLGLVTLRRGYRSQAPATRGAKAMSCTITPQTKSSIQKTRSTRRDAYPSHRPDIPSLAAQILCSSTCTTKQEEIFGTCLQLWRCWIRRFLATWWWPASAGGACKNRHASDAEGPDNKLLGRAVRLLDQVREGCRHRVWSDWTERHERAWSSWGPGEHLLRWK